MFGGVGTPSFGLDVRALAKANGEVCVKDCVLRVLAVGGNGSAVRLVGERGGLSDIPECDYPECGVVVDDAEIR